MTTQLHPQRGIPADRYTAHVNRILGYSCQHRDTAYRQRVGLTVDDSFTRGRMTVILAGLLTAGVWIYVCAYGNLF